MNRTGVVYQKDTGRVVMTVTAPDEEALHLQVQGRDELGLLMNQTANSGEQYVFNGVLVNRPSMELVNPTGLDVVVGAQLQVTGIPVGTRVIYPGGSLTIDDGFIEWSSSTPGNYTFILSNFPFKDEVLNACVR